MDTNGFAWLMNNFIFMNKYVQLYLIVPEFCQYICMFGNDMLTIFSITKNSSGTAS